MNMKEIILQILDEMKDSQMNIASESARENLANNLRYAWLVDQLNYPSP